MTVAHRTRIALKVNVHRLAALWACLVWLFVPSTVRAQQVFMTDGADTSRILNWEITQSFGAFQERPALSPGFDTLGRFTVGDLDGDGRFEIILTFQAQASSGSVRIFTYDPGPQSYIDRGVFTFFADNVGERELTTGDIDGDHRDELILSPFNSPTPPGPRPPGGGSDSLFIVDFTRLAPFEAEVFELPNQFVTAGASVLASDLTGDGIAEIAVLTRNEAGISSFNEALGPGTLFVCSPVLGDPTTCSEVASFVVAASPDQNRFPTSLAAGDLTGDSLPDLVVGYGSGCPGAFDGGVRIYESGGEERYLPLLAAPQRIAIADLERNGVPELISTGGPFSVTTVVVKRYDYNTVGFWEPLDGGGIALLPENPVCGGTTTPPPGTIFKPPAFVAAMKPVDVCNGADDDGDSQIDEDFAASTGPCGTAVGICQNFSTTSCVSGTLVEGTCGGGLTPTDELPCNELDDDCDGELDEVPPPPGPVCGLPGACSGTLRTACFGGAVVITDACLGASTPSPETLDCIDNDCDGATDECDAGQTDWFCQCTPGTDLTFTVDSAVDNPDADAAAEGCLPGAATGNCTLRGVFRRAEQLACRGCRVVADLAADIYPIDGELRLSRGNLLLQGESRNGTVITPSTSCADAACSTLDCVEVCCKVDAACGLPGDGCPKTCHTECSRVATHRVINAIAEPGQAPHLELDALTLRGGQMPELGSGSPEVAGGGIVLTGGGLSLTDAIVMDNRARGRGCGIAVFDAEFLNVVDSVVRDNFNNQNTSVVEEFQCDVFGAAGGETALGGGIYTHNVDVTEITRSAVVDNMAADGGGMSANGPGSITIRNSTFAQNEVSGRGGGFRARGGDILLEFSTFVSNRAGGGSIRSDFEAGGGIDIQAPYRPDQPDGTTTLAAFGNLLEGNSVRCSNNCVTPRAPDCGVESVDVTVTGAAFNLIGGGGRDCLPLGDPATDSLIGVTLDYDDSGAPTCELDISANREAVCSVVTNTEPVPQPGADLGSAVQVAALLGSSVANTSYPSDPVLPPNVPVCPADDQRRAIRFEQGPCSLGSFDANGIPDADGDGIPDFIDPEPLVFSSFFFDGVTGGQITTRGDQILVFHDLAQPEGVVVEALEGGGSTPAEITACGGTLFVSLAAGESVTINCPVADAGPDQVIECTGNGHAAVTLDGTGSYSGNGSLMYEWSAPGVTLVNADQAIATGSFPMGPTTVTLTVDDGLATAVDTALVTVRDSKPPILNIPADVTTATCTGVNIGQAVAVDVCGGPVTITNDAPSSFKAGVYTVTWRATDQFGNQTVKTQRVHVGLGDNTACCPAGTHIVVGTPNNDVINGTSGSDCILGRGAQDTINGLGGNDYVSGGEGNDTIDGGDGNDFVDGGAGQDTLRGGNGNDVILAGDGDDACYGGNNDDLLRGGQGQDRLFGEGGNDSLYGDSGDDTLDGSSGNDLLNGGGPHDQCSGGTGTNTYVLCENQPGSSGPLQASFAVTSDSGTSYCVTLSAKNPTSQNATSWGVTFQLTNATITTKSNGLFNGTTGVITVLPSTGSNQELFPGEVDTTIAFCANRTVSGSPPPSVILTTATFQ